MNLQNRITDLEKELIDLRRYFHKHPEKSWDEYNTQKKIMEYLDKLKIPYVKSAKTGIIATIKGENSPKKIIGIRADIDALPMQELNECEYKSEHEGIMHACGHDTHITMLLGTAKILSEIKDHLSVNVRLIFQPAEEFIEDSGAKYMKEEELIKECDRLIAIHIWSKIKAGYASLRYGPVMSAADTFDVYINGKGGHGALPNQCIDSISAAAQFITEVQRVISREMNPLEPTVISITSIHSGTSSNIIPDNAHLSGTSRTFNNEIRNSYPIIFNRLAKGIGESTKTDIKIDYHMGPPPMINDDACVDTGIKAAELVFGKNRVIEHELQMGGEDFAKYYNPKCILLLGGGLKNEEERFPQHSSYFRIDENVLKLGVNYFVQYVLEYQKEI